LFLSLLQKGASDSELSFNTGQVITILNKIDDDWYLETTQIIALVWANKSNRRYEGEVGGAVGIFPANYVETL